MGVQAGGMGGASLAGLHRHWFVADVEVAGDVGGAQVLAGVADASAAVRPGDLAVADRAAAVAVAPEAQGGAPGLAVAGTALATAGAPGAERAAYGRGLRNAARPCVRADDGEDRAPAGAGRDEREAIERP